MVAKFFGPGPSPSWTDSLATFFVDLITFAKVSFPVSWFRNCNASEPCALDLLVIVEVDFFDADELDRIVFFDDIDGKIRLSKDVGNYAEIARTV